MALRGLKRTHYSPKNLELADEVASERPDTKTERGDGYASVSNTLYSNYDKVRAVRCGRHTTLEKVCIAAMSDSIRRLINLLVTMLLWHRKRKFSTKQKPNGRIAEWLNATDCRSVGLGLRRFESFSFHQYGQSEWPVRVH